MDILNELVDLFLFQHDFFIGNYDDFFYRFIFIRFRKFNWLLMIDSHFNYNFSLRIDQILTSRRETFHLDRKWKHFTAIKTDLSNVTERKQHIGRSNDATIPNHISSSPSKSNINFVQLRDFASRSTRSFNFLPIWHDLSPT